MFKLTISDKVLVDVRGTLRDEEGVERSFDFALLMRRESQDKLLEAEREDTPLAGFLEARTLDWRRVLAEDGSPLPFAPDHFRALLLIAGMRAFVYRAYLNAIAPKGRQGN